LIGKGITVCILLSWLAVYFFRTNPLICVFASFLDPRVNPLLGGEGKTSHELATELGFSVSTIRQESLRIYQALSVSESKDAAKKAITLSLV
jgi:hypothetical protein